MFIQEHILNGCVLSARLCAGLGRCGEKSDGLAPPGLPAKQKWSLDYLFHSIQLPPMAHVQGFGGWL